MTYAFIKRYQDSNSLFLRCSIRQEPVKSPLYDTTIHQLIHVFCKEGRFGFNVRSSVISVIGESQRKNAMDETNSYWIEYWLCECMEFGSPNQFHENDKSRVFAEDHQGQKRLEWVSKTLDLQEQAFNMTSRDITPWTTVLPIVTFGMKSIWSSGRLIQRLLQRSRNTHFPIFWGVFDWPPNILIKKFVFCSQYYSEEQGNVVRKIASVQFNDYDDNDNYVCCMDVSLARLYTSVFVSLVQSYISCVDVPVLLWMLFAFLMVVWQSLILVVCICSMVSFSRTWNHMEIWGSSSTAFTVLKSAITQ